MNLRTRAPAIALRPWGDMAIGHRWARVRRERAWRARAKDGAVNAAIVVASLLASYAALEFLFFRLLLPIFPLTWWVFTPSGPDFFLLNAGRNYHTPGYIALLGDSYAVGLGDWGQANGYRKDRPFHSAHVLRELLNREVVDFGRPGAGSPEAMVLRPTRIVDDGSCWAIPRVAPPGRFVVYFFEGNDLDDNVLTLLDLIGAPEPDLASATDRFLRERYAKTSGWRCHGFLGDFAYRTTRFLRHSRSDLQAAMRPRPPKNRLLVNGTVLPAPPLQVPAMGLDKRQIEQAIIIFERSLRWLRRRFDGIPVTVVYIPAPASVYRFASSDFTSTYVLETSRSRDRDDTNPGPVYSVASMYANSQRICERIRAASLALDSDFLDTRPSLRKKAAHVALHGPSDWAHLNETGYRVLAASIAERLARDPKDQCADGWEADTR